MKKAFVFLAAAVAIAISSPASSQELSGSVKLSCEAILCLSSGVVPGECSPALSAYYGIKKKKWSDTVKARLNFLKLCPIVSDDPVYANERTNDPNMFALVEAIANGGGRCDASALNSETAKRVDSFFGRIIPNVLPSYCTAYLQHTYTDFADTLPVYVGDPQLGGFWVEKKNYAKGLAQYEAVLKQYQIYIQNQQNQDFGSQ